MVTFQVSNLIESKVGEENLGIIIATKKPNILKSRFRPKSFGDLPLKGPVPFSKLCPGEPCLEIIQSFKIEGFAPWLPSH